MALSSDSSTLSQNGQAVTQSNTRRKSSNRKTSAGKASGSKRATPSTSATEIAEILFTEKANPYKQPVPPYIWIDFPQEQERLQASEYVMRFGVGGADMVEISIDKGAWLSCRFASGYWWYDWANISKGKHTLTARIRATDGRWFRTPPRLCDYRP